MNSKQRFLKMLNHETPDRVPIDYLCNPGIDRRLKDHFGLQPTDDEGLRQALNVDFRVANAPYIGPRLHEQLPPETGIDVNEQMGFRTSWVEHESGGYHELCDFPLENADPETIANWPLPDPDDFDYSVIGEVCDAYPDYALVTGGASTGDIINSTSSVRNMEMVLFDLAMEEPATLTFMDRRIDLSVKMLERTFDRYKDKIDLLWIGEDLGCQDRPLVSLDMFRNVLRPRLQKLVDVATAYDIPTMIHSCGSSSWAFEDFIEMGIRMVDTLQPEAVNMDPADLKEKFGDRLAFHGCISTAGPVAYGNAEQTIEDCKAKLGTLMPGGGYCFSPTHMIQDNSPTENVLAMYETAVEYGTYRN